jgi:hypothetical protein
MIRQISVSAYWKKIKRVSYVTSGEVSMVRCLVRMPTLGRVLLVAAAVMLIPTAATAQQPSLLVFLDQDAIDNGRAPNFFTAQDVNDHIAGQGVRDTLPVFLRNPGARWTLTSGSTLNPGWFELSSIPAIWTTIDPQVGGLMNLLLAAPGLGSPYPTGNRGSLLVNVPNVIPFNAVSLGALQGRNVCAVVYDNNIPYNATGANLSGDNLGLAAFRVVSVGTAVPPALPPVQVDVLDVRQVCNAALEIVRR